MSVFVILALYFANHFLVMNTDVLTWLYYVESTQEQDLVLYKDIFEINFPGSYWFYDLIYQAYSFFGKIFPSGFFIVTISFIIELLVIYFVYKINKSFIPLLLYSLSLWNLFGISMLAQREFFIILFMLPYLFILYNEMKNGETASGFKRDLSLFILALGLSIKPFYILAVFPVWLFMVLNTNPKLMVKDAIRGVSFLLLILFIQFLEFPYFYYNILPFLTNYSNINFSSSLPNFMILGFSSLLLFFMFYINKKSFWFYVSIGLVIVVLIQQKGFTYHMLPLVLTSCMFLFESYLDKKGKPIDLGSLGVVLFVFSILPIATFQILQDQEIQSEKKIAETITKNGCNLNKTVFETGLVHMNLINNYKMNRDSISPSSSMFIGEKNIPDFLYRVNKKILKHDLEKFECVVIPKNTNKDFVKIMKDFGIMFKKGEIKANSRGGDLLIYSS